MNKRGKKRFASLLAGMMAMVLLGIIAMPAKALAYGEKIGDDGSTVKNFYTDETGYGGVELFYEDASFTKPAYCLNFRNAYPEGVGYSRHDTLSGGTIDYEGYVGYLDANPGASASTTYMSGEYANEIISKILYIGYPNDAENLGTQIGDAKRFQALTQAAIWHYTDSQQAALDGESNNPILDYISNNPDLTVADDFSVEVWTYDHYMSNRYQNILVVKPASPVIKDTTVRASVEGTNKSSEGGDAAAEIEIEEGESVTLRDTVELDNLDEAVNYILVLQVYKKDGETASPVPGGKLVENISNASEKFTKEYELPVKPDEAGTYTIVAKLYKDSEDNANLLSVHNGNYGKTRETVKVTKTIPEPAEPSIMTSASPSEIEAAAGQTITDTVTYFNLMPEVEYTLIGKLMVKDDQGELDATLYTSEPVTFSVNADSAAEGTQEVVFNVDATTLAGKTLVIFESLKWTENGDAAEVGHTVWDDPKQTVKVSTPPEEGEVTIEISKTDLGGTELEGAKMTVTGTDYEESWTSDGTAKKLTLKPGEYTMKEETAPDNYKQITTAIKFTVSEDGEVTLGVTTVDNGGEIEVLDGNHIVLRNAPEDEPEEDEVMIEVSKQDLGGTELEGAKMTVTGTDYEESWTSTDKAKKLALKPGDYKMKETAAPDGYKQVTTTITFTVDEEGKVTLGVTTVDNGGEIEVQDGRHIVLKDAPEDEPEEPGGDEPEEPGGDEPEEPGGDEPVEPDHDEPDDEEEEDRGGTTPIVKVLHYTTHVSGSKYWQGDETSDRPASVTMHLFANGVEVDSRTVTGAGDVWTFDFGERDLYQAGEPIQYTLTEDTTEDYECSVASTVNKVETESGSSVTFSVTNTAVPKGVRGGDRLGAARNTGDESMTLLWGAAVVLALAGLVIYRRKAAR